MNCVSPKDTQILSSVVVFGIPKRYQINMTLEEWLITNGVSLSEFARKSGITQRQDVWKYVRGRAIPSATNMALIFKATNGAVTPNDFYGLGNENAQAVAVAVAQDAQAIATPHEVAE